MSSNKRRMVPIQVQVNHAALKLIERNKRSQHYRKENTNNNIGGRSSTSQPNTQRSSSTTSLVGMPLTLDQLIGASCLNNGCNMVCSDAAAVDTPCVHHRGILASAHQIDNNGQLQVLPQSWTCCGRKSANLIGCVQGKHNWVKRERVDNVRHEWFYRAGLVHISIFCRSAVPQGTRVLSDGLKLDVTIAHGFGTKQTVKHFDLYAEIVPAESAMLISEKKVELILKQQRRDAWTRLCYDVEGDADGACLVEDGDGETCYAVC